MKKKTNVLRNLIIFILLIVLTFSILFKDQNIGDILKIIVNARLEFIFLGMLCMMMYIVCEAVNLGRTLKKLGEKSIFVKNLKYALIGFFFSAVTPAASGGQPMQVYYMYKDGITVSKSTIALLINLTSYQIITISFALVSLIFNYQYLNGVLIACFIVGILLNLSALTLLIISIFSKRMSKWMINFALKVMKFFKVKNIESKKEKFESELKNYQESAEYVKENKLLMIKTVVITLVQFLFFYCVAYCTYRALGFNEYGILRIISMQSVLYATVSGIPSPGAVGVSEGAFTEIFRNIYPKNIMNSAVLLHRGISFYLLVIVSCIITFVNYFTMNKNKENDT